MDAKAPIRSLKILRSEVEVKASAEQCRIAGIGKPNRSTVRDAAHNATESVPYTYVAEGLGVGAPNLFEAECRLVVQRRQHIANLICQRGCDDMLVRRIRNDELVRYCVSVEKSLDNNGAEIED